MFGFFRRKPPPRPTRQEQLQARPVRLVEAELTPSEGGGGKITVPVRPGRVHRWLLRFPERATKTFEFDAVGVFVWERCDGKTTLRRLITDVARHLRISEREAEVATMSFLQLLVKKGLIGLAVRRKADRADGSQLGRDAGVARRGGP
ncbi:MAG: PqqD family protein [Tepidisphaerales bacterium]